VSAPAPFSRDVLKLDAAQEVARLETALRRIVQDDLRRRGAVLGLSGGIDSSVCAALCVRALGKERVLGLFLPDRDSSPDSLRLGRLLAETLGIESRLEDMCPILEGAGCYRRRDEAIRSVIPEYGASWKSKIVLPDLLNRPGYAVYTVVAQSPQGEERRARLPGGAYREIVAATSFKQRARRMMEYYHADRLQYAVIGTPNRLEHDQGFFVKQGDGAADLKPIAHLYKTQVYELARHLDLPDEIQRRPPTTDTYSLPQSQEEFYFALPLPQLDLCLYGRNRGVPAEEVARAAGLTPEQVRRAYQMIEAKRRATHYLHRPAVLAEPVDEVG
jgi:NAD+ synthase